jgi:hypothetical protein
MRVLTVKQPWAAAIIFGGKTVENRTRSLGPYTGPVAIHAGLQFDHERSGDAMVLVEQELGEEELGRRMINDFLVLGHILGVVDLVETHERRDCWTGVALRDGTTHEEWCSPWAEGGDGFHMVLANPRPLSEPLEYRGGLSLRNLDPAVEARIRAEVDRPPASRHLGSWRRMLPDHSMVEHRTVVFTHRCGHFEMVVWDDEEDVGRAALHAHIAECRRMLLN